VRLVSFLRLTMAVMLSITRRWECTECSMAGIGKTEAKAHTLRESHIVNYGERYSKVSGRRPRLTGCAGATHRAEVREGMR
jgi:hypothetical protein